MQRKYSLGVMAASGLLIAFVSMMVFVGDAPVVPPASDSDALRGGEKRIAIPDLFPGPVREAGPIVPRTPLTAEQRRTHSGLEPGAPIIADPSTRAPITRPVQVRESMAPKTAQLAADPPPPATVHSIGAGSDGWVFDIRALPDGRFITASVDGAIRRWTADFGGNSKAAFTAELIANTGRSIIGCTRADSRGENLFVLDANGNVGGVRRDGAEGRAKWGLPGEGNFTAMCRVDAGARCVALGDSRGFITIHTTNDDSTLGACVGQWRAASHAITGLLATPEGDGAASAVPSIFAADASGGIHAFDLLRLSDGPTLTHLPRATFCAHNGPVTALAISRDARWLASGGRDCIVRLWALHGETSPHRRPGMPIEARGHTGFINDLAFAGDFLASASADRSVRVWHIDGEHLAVRDAAIFTGHRGPVAAVAWVPGDSYRLISAGGGADATLRDWRFTPDFASLVRPRND